MDKARAYGCSEYPGQQTPPSCPACMSSLLPCVLAQGACRNGRLVGFGGGLRTDEQRAFIIKACSAQAYRRRRGNCSQATSASEGAGRRSHRSPSSLRVVAEGGSTQPQPPAPGATTKTLTLLVRALPTPPANNLALGVQVILRKAPIPLLPARHCFLASEALLALCDPESRIPASHGSAHFQCALLTIARVSSCLLLRASSPHQTWRGALPGSCLRLIAYLHQTPSIRRSRITVAAAPLDG
jgi:hypothetical protein